VQNFLTPSRHRALRATVRSVGTLAFDLLTSKPNQLVFVATHASPTHPWPSMDT